MYFSFLRAGGWIVVIASWVVSSSYVLAQIQPDCDLNGDGLCSVRDINDLSIQIIDGNTVTIENERFDVDENGVFDRNDLEQHINGTLNRLNGDLDINGEVEFLDFLRLSDNFTKSGTWAFGDLDADGTVGFADFLIQSDNFGKSHPQLEVSVEVNVSELNGLFTYEYTLTNNTSSPKPINIIFLDVADGESVVLGERFIDPALGIESLSAPSGWAGEYLPFQLDETGTQVQRDEAGNPVFNPIEEVTFITSGGCEAPGLLPGGAAETFIVESEYGPGDRNLFAGNLTNPCSFFTASYEAQVLGPAIAPAEVAASVPEPSSVLLLLFGSQFLLLVSRSSRGQ